MVTLPAGSFAAETSRQSAEEVAQIALQKYRAKEFQIAARMYLQVYALSNTAVPFGTRENLFGRPLTKR